MAVCPASELIAEACENGFLCLADTERLAMGVELQLLRDISGTELTTAELIAQACENGFLCLEPNIANALILQLLCEISSA